MDAVLWLTFHLLLLLLANSSMATGCVSAPDIIAMFRGVDITTLDLFPSEPRSSNGFRRPLFAFNCPKDSNSSSFYPINSPEEAVKLKQANGLNIRLLHKDLRDYKKFLAARVGLNSSLDYLGGFSDSASYNKIREEIFLSHKSVIEVGNPKMV